ncbi:MAG TPA: NAD(P)/FAD-dependent oxidoreductase [Mycobacteriales bacterium]|jgi:cation diffusion facilitator CzcD-associated flavoprotein CzcO|nr:NAD(P)/FAD-dependent oxidoreductase [Mycobacteriales bacterium]
MASDQHVDVLIVGAGLSGIGAACRLQMECPGKTFTILEAREAIGGTWDLFRYPGIRSDSDMYTLGYDFRPWTEAKAIADGPSILNYIRETARDYGVDRHIRFNHRVVRAAWSTDDAVWTVESERSDTGETVRFTCGFLFMCSGYYRYDQGYLPEFPGVERFAGPVVHPQHWPEDLDYDGKRVVVVGSGATAVTLVPAMAERAAHVTMLQRSPTYVVSMPAKDPIATRLRRWLPEMRAYQAVRWKNVLLTMLSYQLSRRVPQVVRAGIRKGVEKQLGPDYDIDTHFNPRYDPWDQRMCLVPDGDLFAAISSGRASIVTDTIETFDETGIQLTSGERLEADVVITATGLNMLALGGMQISVDGRAVELHETVAYKGMMFSGIPNLAAAMGYTNASWTLKCDLVCAYVCRLLGRMDELGVRQVTPRWPGGSLPDSPFIDLTSGYVMRSIDKFPKQGRRSPWRLYQNYIRDIVLLKRAPLDDGAVEFSNPVPAGRPAERVAV